MSEFQEFSHPNTPGAPRWVGLALGVLGGLSLIGLGLGWSALNQAKSLEQTTVASKQASEALSQRLAKEDEINQQLQSDLKVIADKLNDTQGELITARKQTDRKSTRLNYSHSQISYAVFCLQKKRSPRTAMPTVTNTKSKSA